ncbi:metalloregulator ArsR/SmtB family transcription factor [Kangiella koreensis]|uniref:Transcriptional regulator, ArsR family n=1 Tax=Kangiella koreensis (strain DSM 16069 / JCM 12317 / KCTC 12182 / SW-125) TaxID=523791 RepID=C7RBY0_KANKD|nr:metalloregulator ArsR/SmtB family transcription factor [Kangiella koreensis]ACV26772.1 transcriptional regulator, ArsR family [Kangiella koreensis DSM 16069]
MKPVELFKCLADETRLRCLLLIQRESELCVCELMEALDESQPKISRHLAQLRQCGLLLDRRDSKWVYYRLNSEQPSWIGKILAETAQSNEAFINNNIKRLQKMSNRPERSSCC